MTRVTNMLQEEEKLRILLDACRSELERLRKLAADFKNICDAGRKFLQGGRKSEVAELPQVTTQPAEGSPQAANPYGWCDCCDVEKVCAGAKNASALAKSYLQYKIIEALQPHPAYETDDGFHPRCVVCSMSLHDDLKARAALAELGGSNFTLIGVIAELVENGTIMQTAYEPCYGDVMLGLPENLGIRRNAHQERINLVIQEAAQFGLNARWNDDGTGWLETSGGDVAQPPALIWELLSYLDDVATSVTERPHALN